MDVRSLKYFLAIYAEGSISRAAEKLYMTQPPLSASLARLEEEVGAKLMERTGRGVMATPAGEELARRAEDLLVAIDETRESVASIGVNTFGSLRLSAVPPVLWGPLQHVLARFDAELPEVSLFVLTQAPREVTNAVRTSRADIGFVAVSDPAEFAARYGKELAITRAGTSPLVLVQREKVQGSRRVADLKALSEQRWIIPRTTIGVSSLPEEIVACWGRAGAVPRHIMHVDSVDTALACVNAGLGVTMVPSTLLSHPTLQGLHTQLVDEAEDITFIGITARRSTVSTPTQRLLGMLRELQEQGAA